MTQKYPRDLAGYGANPPDPQWPNGARIALQIVLNYEEGGESCILHGDPASESFLSEIIGAAPRADVRHLSMESIYEYGSRVGVWRLKQLFESYQVPVTVFAVGMAAERNPEPIRALHAAGHEICSHGYRWIDYQYIDEATEREHMREAIRAIENITGERPLGWYTYQDYDIKAERAHMRKAIEIITRITGERPLGWYTGRTSPNTRRLVIEEGGFLYDADDYSDDLPFWDSNHGRAHLVIPYTLDVNDMRFATGQGFNSGEQFFQYLKDSFDVLYAEGRRSPRMMSVGLHCRLAGRPGRIAALERFLRYARSHEDVWWCRRIDIARHWYERHSQEVR
jgi:peptidoglycan/xylan/chitin deacetylase (PgdA/CDA1 family)